MIDIHPLREGIARSVVGMRKEQAQLRRASWAFTTRRIPQGTACAILSSGGAPKAGDLVLARVTALGQHADLQLVNGRHRHMFVGDEIVVAYGNRYASSQFEAVVPETLGPCHLVAGGGIAARARSWHERIARGPTRITPLGLLADGDGRRINLEAFSLPPLDISSDYQPTTIAVVGTSMDSGKTQTAVYLVRGLVAAGLRVGYAKATGTGAGGDIYWLKDAGADPVLDFTDTGMASTYLESADRIEQGLVTLVAHIARHGVDAIVVEIADGVLQHETAALLRSAAFARVTGGIVLAARDSMGASAGVGWMANLATPVLALSGVMTAAPLQRTEAAEATGLPIHDREALASPSVAIDLIGHAQHNLEAIARRPNDAA
jgi:hypothetical protein